MSIPVRQLVIILTTNLILLQAISAQQHPYRCHHTYAEADILKSEQAYKKIYTSARFDAEIERRIGISPQIFKANNHGIIRQVIYSETSLASNKNAAADVILDAVFESLYMLKDELNFDNVLIKSDPVPPSYKEEDGPCVNMDFETGDLTGWRIFETEVDGDGGTIGGGEVSSPGVQHTIVGPGQDSLTGLSMTNPDGGEYSLLLGDGMGRHSKASRIYQSFLVSEENSSFTYSYAVVLADPPGHDPGEKPFFQVRIYDLDDPGWVECGRYSVVAGSDLAAESWTPFDYVQPDIDTLMVQSGWYKDWETVFVPLEDYIGHNVGVSILVGDCSLGGHFGYAYVDAGCATPNLIPPGTLLCQNQSIELEAPDGAAEYLWNTGETTQTINVSDAGDYSVTITPVSGSSCNMDMYANITSVPSTPIALPFPNTTSACLGDEIIFTDSSYVDGTEDLDAWHWDFGDASGITNTTNTAHIYDSIGSYEVELVVEMILDTLGVCRDTAYSIIDIHPYPIAAFDHSEECLHFGTEFNDESSIVTGNIDRWEWSFNGDTMVNSNMQNPIYTFASAGTHEVTLKAISEFDCASSVSRFVKVHQLPSANFETERSKVTIQNPRVQFINNSALNESNTWTFSHLGMSTEFAPSFTFPSEDQGTYEVCLDVISENGCTDNLCQNIFVEGVASSYMPTSFTPNGDGINDLFFPVTYGLDEEHYFLSIYDRWGKMVFSSTSLNEKWNGTQDELIVKDGIYTVTLQARNKFTKEVFVHTGSVTIFR